jgi:hypothetical protein
VWEALVRGGWGGSVGWRVFLFLLPRIVLCNTLFAFATVVPFFPVRKPAQGKENMAKEI